MNSQLRLLCCALAVMMSSTGWARLGETPKQCEARYGVAVMKKDIGEPGEVTLVYRKAGLLIHAVFKKGRARMIFFEREKENGSSQLLNSEIELLLKANSEGKRWRELSQLEAGVGRRAWMLDDDSATAVFDAVANRLVFTQEDFAETLGQEKLKGF